MANPIVTFEMADGKTFRAELYPDVAPNTVNNFISLVRKGFYDGIIFHRVIAGFMIQGGDPDGIGTGGPGYHIKGEFSANGVKNALRHTRGVLSMARAGHPDSAGSQFFVMHADADYLDGLRGVREGHGGDGDGGRDRQYAHRLPRSPQNGAADEEGDGGDVRRRISRARSRMITFCIVLCQT